MNCVSEINLLYQKQMFITGIVFVQNVAVCGTSNKTHSSPDRRGRNETWLNPKFNKVCHMNVC